jgi:transcriptional regulator with XRE-family HTH domain
VPKTERTSLRADPDLARERERLARAIVSILKKARSDASLSQRQLARRLGWTAAKLSNIESLRTPLSWADALLWAKRTTEMEPEELFQRYLYEIKPALRKGLSYRGDPRR